MQYKLGDEVELMVDLQLIGRVVPTGTVGKIIDIQLSSVLWPIAIRTATENILAVDFREIKPAYNPFEITPDCPLNSLGLAINNAHTA